MRLSALARLDAIQRRIDARSPVFGPSMAEIADSLGAVCSDPGHPDNPSALEFAQAAAEATAGPSGPPRIDAARLSDAALDFSIRLLRGAFLPQSTPH